MLCRSIDITLGLINGATGTVKSVKYSIDQANMVHTYVESIYNDSIW